MIRKLVGVFQLLVGRRLNIHGICTDFVSKGFNSWSPLDRLAAILNNFGLASELLPDDCKAKLVG